MVAGGEGMAMQISMYKLFCSVQYFIGNTTDHHLSAKFVLVPKLLLLHTTGTPTGSRFPKKQHANSQIRYYS